MMLKLFLNATDDFLCNRIKNSFSHAEKRYATSSLQIDLKEELNKFQENPLGCMIGLNSNFEADIKVKIKLIIGFFFVLVPLTVFSLFSYLINIPLEIGFIATFAIAVLVSSRMEEISRRYVQLRMLELQA
jgi:hypothetical protein